jgi:hypothetical protein
MSRRITRKTFIRYASAIRLGERVDYGCSSDQLRRAPGSGQEGRRSERRRSRAGLGSTMRDQRTKPQNLGPHGPQSCFLGHLSLPNTYPAHPTQKPRKIRGFVRLLQLFSRLTTTPKGTRTPVFAVRGRCPRPLDDGGAAFIFYSCRRGRCQVRPEVGHLPAPRHFRILRSSAKKTARNLSNS